jgi:lysophospholipid acyltransferase (LPLAT)-like uncharacterized protein
MKLRRPWLVSLVALFAACLIRLWMRSLRYRLVPLDGRRHPTDPRVEPCIYSLWHETILFATIYPARIRVLISRHADGELIAQTCRYMRYEAVRGSSTRHGARALLQMCRGSRRAHFMVTPDGPRGPRRQVQPGLVYLASRTGLPVVACGIGYERAWRARSWDRFAVPWPWTAAVCVIAPPLHVPPDLDRAGLERYRLLAEERMHAATRAAEALARGRPVPAEPLPGDGARRLRASA